MLLGPFGLGASLHVPTGITLARGPEESGNALRSESTTIASMSSAEASEVIGDSAMLGSPLGGAVEAASRADLAAWRRPSLSFSLANSSSYPLGRGSALVDDRTARDITLGSNGTYAGDVVLGAESGE